MRIVEDTHSHAATSTFVLGACKHNSAWHGLSQSGDSEMMSHALIRSRSTHTDAAGLRKRCRHIKGLMQEAGLAVREDVMGNIYGRWQGSDASAGAIPVVGCHRCPRVDALMVQGWASLPKALTAYQRCTAVHGVPRDDAASEGSLALQRICVIHHALICERSSDACLLNCAQAP